MLLGASYYFYMSWKPEYIVLIMLSTIITYLSGIYIGKTDKKKRKKFILTLSLVSNLGILFVFKYFNFFNDSLINLFANFNIEWGVPNFKLLLPVGISFYTFQALSYSIDVYRGKIKPERNFGIYALYVSFFPQLVAGPIERSINLLPQFYSKKRFDLERVISGLKQALWGYFKKVVIADGLALIVDRVYNNPRDYTGIPLIIATVFFAFQIYCDFSGYSDIAIGIARILGFDLMENFRRPYFSKSIKEFWSRWHISLSTWFKDYLYIPLGGSRISRRKTYINLFITFLVSGLWHGANWTFVIWGSLHGIYSVIERIISELKPIDNSFKNRERSFISKLANTLMVFVLVDFAWIFFRANNLSDAFYIIRHLFSGIGSQLTSIGSISATLINMEIMKYDVLILGCSLLTMFIYHILKENGFSSKKVLSRSRVFKWGFYYILILWVLIFGYYGSTTFIYFQF